MPVITVPTYAADLRRLINDNFSADPHPDVLLLGGSLATRLRCYPSAGYAGAGTKGRFFALEGSALSAPGTIRLLPAREFFVRTLSHRFTVSAVLLDLVQRRLPRDVERDAERAVIRTYRDRYAGLLLPTPILELIRTAALSANGQTFLSRLERVRLEVLTGRRCLADAQDRRDRIRAEALVSEGLAEGLMPLQVAVLELYADVLLIQRADREDLLRCEAAAGCGESSVAREFRLLDRAADLTFELMISHVLRADPIRKALAALRGGGCRSEPAPRPPYHRYGLLDPDACSRAGEEPTVTMAAPVQVSMAQAPAVRASIGDSPRLGTEPLESDTPTLDRLGLDLTARAAGGELSKVVGREDEIESIIEILCRRTKRNPLLVGPAGIGKTAMVSGLASRIATGLVPKRLVGSRVVELQVASLLAGTQSIGDIEDRVLPIIEEASRTGAVLFFDEVHQLVGAGAYRNNDNDIAQILKPALARGDLAIIGATTAGEYRHYLAGDTALERRFQVLEVREPARDVTLSILRAVREELEKTSEILIGDDILPPLLRLADQALPGRSFPDKAIDVLENAAARAVVAGDHRVTTELVQASVSRMTGLPLDVDRRLHALQDSLSDLGLMDDADIVVLVRRLRVTLRGLGLAPARPKAVLAICGDGGRSDEIAESLARELFGDPERTHTADLARVLTVDDLQDLLGGRRGHRSSSDSAIQRACRSPGSVLVLRNLDGSDPSIQRIFVEALRTGHLLDASGSELRLGGTMVLLTSERWDGSSARPIGFGGAGASPEAASNISPELRPVIDVVSEARRIPCGPEVMRAWVERVAVPRIIALLRERDLEPPPHAELLELVTKEIGRDRSMTAVDRLVERMLLPRLLDAEGNGPPLGR